MNTNEGVFNSRTFKNFVLVVEETIIQMWNSTPSNCVYSMINLETVRLRRAVFHFSIYNYTEEDQHLY
jgi:hypothetical protein